MVQRKELAEQERGKYLVWVSECKVSDMAVYSQHQLRKTGFQTLGRLQLKLTKKVFLKKSLEIKLPVKEMRSTVLQNYKLTCSQTARQFYVLSPDLLSEMLHHVEM